MANYVDELTGVLSQELETFNNFLSLLDEQHRQIAKNDIDGLTKTNAELDLLSNQAGDLERRRVAITEKISGQMSLDRSNPTLNELLDRLDGFSPERLKSLRQAILDVHDRIVKKSERNKFLIDKSRYLIAESIKILGNRPTPTYARPRRENMAVADGSLVNRSA